MVGWCGSVRDSPTVERTTVTFGKDDGSCSSCGAGEGTRAVLPPLEKLTCYSTLFERFTVRAVSKIMRACRVHFPLFPV
eukprot:5384273-Pyramimonas_sp.AAC.1